PAEGLRVTSVVAQAPVRATVQPVKAQSIMHARLAVAARLDALGSRSGRGDVSRVGPARVEPARGVQGVQPGRVTSSDRPRATSASDPVVVPSGVQAPVQEPVRVPSSGGGELNGPEQTFGGLPVTPTTPTPTPPDRPQAPVLTAPQPIAPTS